MMEMPRDYMFSLGTALAMTDDPQRVAKALLEALVEAEFIELPSLQRLFLGHRINEANDAGPSIAGRIGPAGRVA